MGLKASDTQEKTLNTEMPFLQIIKELTIASGLGLEESFSLGASSFFVAELSIAQFKRSV